MANPVRPDADPRVEEIAQALAYSAARCVTGTAEYAGVKKARAALVSLAADLEAAREALRAVREQQRQHALDPYVQQRMTDDNESYHDGYFNGRMGAVHDIDAALAAGSVAPPDGEGSSLGRESSAADGDGADSRVGHHESVGERQGRQPAPEDAALIAACPTPVYHETHRYCPSCPWTEAEPVTVIDCTFNLRQVMDMGWLPPGRVNALRELVEDGKPWPPEREYIERLLGSVAPPDGDTT